MKFKRSLKKKNKTKDQIYKIKLTNKTFKKLLKNPKQTLLKNKYKLAALLAGGLGLIALKNSGYKIVPILKFRSNKKNPVILI